MSFITFEGIDCSGKTTQIKLLKKEFGGKKGIVFTANPGDTKLGKELRNLLLHKSNLKISEINEAFLFFTGICDNYEKNILPSLSQKKIVLCDRYYDSTIAYQGFGRRLDVNKIIKLAEISGLPEPDLTFLFRIEYKLFRERRGKKDSNDNIENSKAQFYESVIAGYDELANIYKTRYIVIDGSQSIEKVNLQVKKILSDKLNIC